MKTKFISIIFLLASIIFAQNNISFAQDPCAVILDDSTYNICCAEDSNTIGRNIGACSAYIAGPRCANINNYETYALCCAGSTSPLVNKDNCLGYQFKNLSDTPLCDSITDSNYAQCCYYSTPQNSEKCNAHLGLGGFGDGGGTPPPAGGSTGNNSGVNSPKFTGVASDYCDNIKFVSFLNILIWGKCVISTFIIPLIFTLAFVFFLWNIAQFIRSADKSTAKEEARQRMIWGMIALFVMVSVWGIIAIVSNIFGITPTVPMLQTEYLTVENADN